MINDWNAQEGQTSTLGINEFADWTEDELKGLRSSSTSFGESTNSATQLKVNGPEEEWNWVTQGMVAPVHNQGATGSGDAIASVDAVSSALKIAKGGNLLNLSPL